MGERTIDFRYAPALSWTCIGLPDDDHKSLVLHDGSLQYGLNRVIRFGLRHASRPPACQQQTESAESAVVRTTLDYGFAPLELHTLADVHEGHRRDVVLWELKASATLKAPLIGAIVVTMDESTPRNIPGLPTPPADEQPPGDRGGETVAAICSLPTPLSICSDYEHCGRNTFSTTPEPLLPDRTIRGAFVLPLDPADRMSGVDLAWCNAAIQRARAFWNEFRSSTLTLSVPDAGIRDMLTACARNILQARVVKVGLPFYQVGPLIYRGLWVVDGHFITEAARYLGHDREADLAWDALLRFRREDGSISTHPHHTKETGIALATLVRMTELSGNWSRLRDAWPTVVRGAVERIAQMRQEAAELPPSHPCYKLLPESYGDGGIGGRRPEYTTTLWMLAGLKQIAAAAKRLGMDDAIELQARYASLLADFRAHAERHSACTPAGFRYLPMAMFPEQHNYGPLPTDSRGTALPWTEIGPGVATWAFCHSIYPGEVFSADDELVTDLVALHELLDHEEGQPKETGWLPWHGLWNYHGSFAAHVALYAGRPGKAIDYLYAMANHAAPTRVWREEQSLRSHPQMRCVGDMPHNWASAEFIRLVRHLLVFEVGDELHLLPGLPRDWIVSGDPVIVERTPTRFGRVSLRVDAVGGEVTVMVQTELSVPPERVVLHLPTGACVVRIDGRPGSATEGPLLDLPARERVQVRFILDRS